MNLMDEVLLRKCAIVWMVNDQLKNNSRVEHNRHCSPINFVVNVTTGLISYYQQHKKPSLNINHFQTLFIAYP